MAVNLKALSPAQLQALIKDAQSQMEDARKSQVHSVREKIDAILKNNGLTIDEVYPTRRSKGSKAVKKSSVAPKYRNPADAEQTWSGRGKRPLWLTAALKKRGTSLENFLIEGGKSKAPAKKAAKKQARKAAK